MTDEQWMQQALELAKAASSDGEVPVGALIVQEGQIIGTGYNRPIRTCDPTAHAEIVALRAAASNMGNYRLTNATLYCTLEPCAMCAGAIIQARLAKVVFAALEPKAGAIVSTLQLFRHGNHRVVFEHGILADASGALLQQFFKARRG